MEEVKLLGHSLSPYSRRVEIALKLKGIKYEYIEEDLLNKSDLLLKSNPVHKKIPVLLHNDRPIAESLVILEYIDEAFPGTPILPQDPYEKAIARFWAKFIDDKCPAGTRKLAMLKGEEQEKAKEEIQEALKFLDNELKDKKFFGGDDINFVDITANFIALWIGVFEEISGVELLIEERYPRLCRWIKEYLNCNIIKENMPPRDKVLARQKARYAAANASN